MSRSLNWSDRWNRNLIRSCFQRWTWRTIFCSATITMLGCDGGMSGRSILAAAAPASDKGIAVVELFTSEGCSSCPPAEQVLADIAVAADHDGRPVIALAFHVDYWNNLGWADPFSSAAFSARQARYSKVFGLDEVYTPQMIVNGHAQFNGSDRGAAADAITLALSKPAAASVATKLVHDTTGYQVHYTVDRAEAGAVVNVAVVEQGLSSKVQRGENAGRELHDPNVVRWFSSAPLDASGQADIAIPLLPSVKLDHAMVVVYVQRSSDWTVLGAAASRFP